MTFTNHMINSIQSPIQAQRGVALIVSMVMLVVITLISVAVMGGSRLEWMMATNSRAQNDANIRAEAALRDGEAAARGLGNPDTFAGWGTPDDAFFHTPYPGDPVTPEPLNLNLRDPNNWGGLGANATTVAPAGTVNEFVVEYMGCRNTSGAACATTPECSTIAGDSCIYTFRIWGFASDNNNRGSTRITQSLYVRNVTIFILSGSGSHFASSVQYMRLGYAEIYNTQIPDS